MAATSLGAASFDGLARAGDLLRALSGWKRFAASLVAGGLSALAFEPFNIFAAQLLGYAVLVLLLEGVPDARRRTFRFALTGWAFGFGQFLVGLYWIGNAFEVDAAHHAWQIPFVLALLPGGLALYGGYLVGNFGAGQGSAWGGYAYGQQSQQAAGFLAAGFLNTQKSFDAAFHATLNHGNYSVESDSMAAGALWGFSNTYMSSTAWTKGALTYHFNTAQYQTMGATLGTNALANANGNVGVNVAAGADHAQANNVAIASLNAQPVYASAQVFANQSSKGSASISQFMVNASVGDGALAGATGNVGVNVASGVGNVQGNSLAAAVSQGGNGWFKGGAANSTAQTDQVAGMKASGDFVANASLGNGALQWASGNVGVNVAAGIGNVQANSLAISAIK